MNLGLLLTIISLVYIILITGIYFSKKRIALLENKVYETLLIVTIIGFVINIISFILDVYFPNLIFLRVLMIKLYYSYLITFLFCMILYLMISSNSKKKAVVSLEILYCIALFINAFLPVGFATVNQQVYVSGANIYFVYLVFGAFIIGISLYLILNRKKINKKAIPSFFYVILLVPVLIIQAIYPELLLEPCLISFLLVLMYHTIENPDLKVMSELELAKQNAERANTAKTDFLSSMSHEIRTPLNAIVGFSNSILEDKTLSDAKAEAKDILMASQNLLEIVNGILDISKIEAGKMEVVEVEYRPKEIFDNIIKLIKPRIGEKPIKLKLNISKDIPVILYGDMGKVREIITNLLTNAVKYTEEGFIELSIQCINEKDTSKLVISVEDTGRGIKPEKIDKLFTKFERLEEDKNTTLEGTGLGLAITKSLVEMLGGKIIVQSKYGSGSKFTVYLKQKIVKLVEENQQIEAAETSDLLDYSKKKILVVDDNMLNIKVATRLLKNYSIIPDTLLSGEECLEKIKTVQYDLILMDDMMPNLSGTETIKKLKENKTFDTPVVVLTANAISGMKEKYLNAGFSDYLAKPIDKLELERVLKKYLEDKK